MLVGAGLYLTCAFAFCAVVHFKDIFTSLSKSRSNAKGGIFIQAFAIGIGTRIGIGNIAGVALALVLGGPVLFWMWVVALIGMATGFHRIDFSSNFQALRP